MRATGTTDDDIDIQHIVCCDPNTALCGSDVSDVPFTDMPLQYECPLCIWADTVQASCPSPTCPGWDPLPPTTASEMTA
jgi:hypothetical protein